MCLPHGVGEAGKIQSCSVSGLCGVSIGKVHCHAVVCGLFCGDWRVGGEEMSGAAGVCNVWSCWSDVRWELGNVVTC